MAISIDFLSNVRPFLKGTDDVDTALDKVADSLDGLVADSKQTGTKMATSIGQAGDKMEQSFRDLEQQARESYKATAAASQDAGTKIELGAREQRKVARETFHEIGDEAKQNAAESFSSFTGSSQSFLDALQGTFGGVIASLPPQFAILGAAGAATIGLISGQLQKADENSQAFLQDVSEITAALIDAGSNGSIPIDTILSKLKQLATEADKDRPSLEKLFETAKDSGSDFQKLAQAYAGNTEGLARLRKEAEAKLAVDERQLKVTADAALAAGRGEDDATNAAQKRKLQQQQYVEYLRQASDMAKTAAHNEELYEEAGGKRAEKLAAATKAQTDANQAVLDAISPSDALTQATTAATDAEQKRAEAVAKGTKDSSDSWQDYAHDVKASADQILSVYEQQIKAQEEWNTNSQNVVEKYGTRVLQFFTDMGPDGKAALQNAIDTWSDADWSRLQDDTQREMAAAGQAGANAYNDNLRYGIPSEIPGPQILPGYPSPVDVRNKLRQIMQAAGPVDVDINGNVSVRVKGGRALL